MQSPLLEQRSARRSAPKAAFSSVLSPRRIDAALLSIDGIELRLDLEKGGRPRSGGPDAGDDDRVALPRSHELSESECRAHAGIHLAFQAPDRGTVEAFYEAALAAGGRDNGAAGERRYHPGYYAAYVLDPDGNDVEAVHHGPPSDRSSQSS